MLFGLGALGLGKPKTVFITVPAMRFAELIPESTVGEWYFVIRCYNTDHCWQRIQHIIEQLSFLELLF